ncbi:hypothetical protein L6R52_18260 [Myxococcota bacterium]|nr:hypothetical protein [Myxococcota bacterium]
MDAREHRAPTRRDHRVGAHAPLAIACALVCALVCALPTRAVAQEEAAPVDVTSAFTETFRRRLGGGLTSRVLVEMELVDAAGASVATTVRACQLRLDVWDDVLFVAVTDADRTRRNKFVLTDEALRACGRVEATPIAERSLLAKRSGYRLVVRVALNPVSTEVLDRTREFMANPRGASGAGARPRAFFGAVAKLFRSDSAASGERFTFRSQPLERP